MLSCDYHCKKITWEKVRPQHTHSESVYLGLPKDMNKQLGERLTPGGKKHKLVIREWSHSGNGMRFISEWKEIPEL